MHLVRPPSNPQNLAATKPLTVPDFLVAMGARN